jgi:hypothetical protein
MSNIKIISCKTKFPKSELNRTPAGLARTKRIIRYREENEINFMKLCQKIEKSIQRAELQRNVRREKRKKLTTTDF